MEKASFRGPWRHRRGLLPADAFFEKGHRIARSLMANRFGWRRYGTAGLAPMARGGERGGAHHQPNELVAPLHERMPVIIPAGWSRPGARR